MKKVLIVIIIIFLFIINYNKSSINAFNYMSFNENDIYFLDFTNDCLNTRNIKLKLSIFTGYNYKVNKIYPKKVINKLYYSYDFLSIDKDTEKFTNEYINDLKNNYYYNIVDDVKKSGINLVGIELYSQKEAIERFKKKYPNVKISNIDNKK